MKYLLVPGLVLLTFCANALSQELPLSAPRVTVGGKAESAEGAFENILSEVSPYRDFQDRLQTAIQTRDMAALQALYQTNGVSAGQLSDELNRWPPMLEGDAQSRVSLQSQGTIFRDFSLSNPMWKHLAERLTTHKATHLIQLMTSEGFWMLR